MVFTVVPCAVSMVEGLKLKLEALGQHAVVLLSAGTLAAAQISCNWTLWLCVMLGRRLLWHAGDRNTAGGLTLYERQQIEQCLQPSKKEQPRLDEVNDVPGNSSTPGSRGDAKCP